MYESPITIFTRTLRKEISEKQDEYIFATIEKELGCEVNKEELIKALAYDRNQYRKGYEDGKACSPLIITNGDRIRAMADEELAEFCFSITDDVASYYGGDGYKPKYPVASKGWLDWLKEEAKDGNN